MTDREIQAFVDRIEGDKAVLLLGTDEQDVVTIPAAYLPDGVGEGDVLTIVIRYEPEATSAAEDRVKKLIEKLSNG